MQACMETHNGSLASCAHTHAVHTHRSVLASLVSVLQSWSYRESDPESRSEKDWEQGRGVEIAEIKFCKYFFCDGNIFQKTGSAGMRGDSRARGGYLFFHLSALLFVKYQNETV